MEKAYKNISLFFIIITIIVFIGFYNTYFVFFPDFNRFKTFHHVHAIVMILWLLILIIQPILINKRKYKWHRAIGKISYIMVPIIVILMLVAYKNSFFNTIAEHGVAHSESLNMLFLPFTDVLPFATFYILAIINRKKIASHLRHMISTAVVVVSAGLLRVLMAWLGMDFIEVLYTSIVAMALVFVGLIYYDFRNEKFVNNKSFLTAILIFFNSKFAFIICALHILVADLCQRINQLTPHNNVDNVQCLHKVGNVISTSVSLHSPE